MTDKRYHMILAMVEEGLPRNKIDEALASVKLDPLTDEEAAEYGLALPSDVTAADVGVSKETLPEAPAPGVNAGPVLATNPVTGAPYTALTHQVVSLCGAMSKLLHMADPKSWEEYKAMKSTDPSPAGKVKAYQWAWERLLAIGYQPTSTD